MIEFIPFAERYAEDAVNMWRASKEAAIGLPERHDVASHRIFLTEHLVKTSRVYLAIDTSINRVVGLMALQENELTQLYIHGDYQRRGIGSAFISLAKSLSPSSLALYTFEVNTGAQSFYEQHGFVIVGRGSENEENLPDIRYEWNPRVSIPRRSMI